MPEVHGVEVIARIPQMPRFDLSSTTLALGDFPAWFFVGEHVLQGRYVDAIQDVCPSRGMTFLGGNDFCNLFRQV